MEHLRPDRKRRLLMTLSLSRLKALIVLESLLIQVILRTLLLVLLLIASLLLLISDFFSPVTSPIAAPSQMLPMDSELVDMLMTGILLVHGALATLMKSILTRLQELG